MALETVESSGLGGFSGTTNWLIAAAQANTPFKHHHHVQQMETPRVLRL